MNLELDHVFILVEPEAVVADLLLELGLKESFSRRHKGQGTSNRRFVFSNGMLEFLWLRDENEAQKGPGRDLNFARRKRNPSASPFGIILRRKDNDAMAPPFKGWTYQPDFFDPPMAFHVGENASQLEEPLCIYAPFIEPVVRPAEKGVFRNITQVNMYTPLSQFSEALIATAKADLLTIEMGEDHLMAITFDDHQQGKSRDCRPDIPLILHW